MSLADIVNVTVTTQNPGLTLAGFGIPLIAGVNMAWVERTRSYNSISAGTTDFANTTPEWQAMNAIFSQRPAPPTVMVGRCALKPTQAFSVAIANVGAVGVVYNILLNNLSSGSAASASGTLATYTVVAAVAWAINTAYVKGQTVTNDTGKLYTCITSGTSAGSGGPTGTNADITDNTAHWMYAGASGTISNDTIVNGLKSAVDALSITGLTAAYSGSALSRILTLTMTQGLWLGVEVQDVSAGAVGGLMYLTETESDPGIATDLAAIAVESAQWYGLLLLFKSSAIIAAAAGWVESNGKLFIVATADTKVATDADSGATDIAHALKASSRARTGPMFHPRNFEFADCAEMGRFFPINPGGDNWRMKSLSGPTPVALTATQITNLNAKHCNYYYSLGASGGSVSVIGGNGTVSDNEYIDVIRFLDWYVATLQVALVNLELQNEKIPYTDAGIALIEAVIRAINKQGIAAGGIAANPAPVVTAPLVADVPTADKQTRTLNNLNTTWTLAGAINKLNVNVQVNS